MKKLSFDITPIILDVIKEFDESKVSYKAKDITREVLNNLPLYQIEYKPLKTHVKEILNNIKNESKINN